MHEKNTINKESALVLVSGGQDSTTSLVWAINTFKNVSGIAFFYHQKHAIEIEAAKTIAKQLNVPLKIQDISFVKDLVISNLFVDKDNVNENHPLNPNVPAAFVPYRNLIFLTLAAAWASTLKIRHLVAGVCQTDYSGYADCRDVFIQSAQQTLNLATDFEDQNIMIHTPLMFKTKAETFKMAEDQGCLDIIIKETMTCYNGDERMNDFGKGCRNCPACKLREKGFNEFQQQWFSH